MTDDPIPFPRFASELYGAAEDQERRRAAAIAEAARDRADPRPRKAAPQSKFQLIPLEDITIPATPAWLIKGVLPSSGLAVIYGPPGCGKTFLALHKALCLASGAPFAGKAVRRTGVVYIAAEAGEGMKSRVVAAKLELGVRSAPFDLVTAAPNLGAADGDTVELIRCIRAQSDHRGSLPGVVVIDTLARAIHGADENSSRDMGVFIANCDRIARAFGCLVIAIHHQGKAAEAGMRGSSALHGAADVEWQVTADDGFRSVRLAKCKEGRDDLSWTFKLRQVEVGIDEDGDPIETCVVSDMTSPSIKAQAPPLSRTAKVPASLKLLMDAFNAALSDHAKDVRPYATGPMVRAVRRTDVRDAFMSRHVAEEQEARKKSFNRGIARAVENRMLVAGDVNGEAMLWLP